MKSISKKLILLALIALFTACNNDDDAPHPPAVFERLTSGKWYMESIEWNSVPGETSDCQKSTFFWFLKDGVVVAENWYEDSGGDCKILSNVGMNWSLASDTDLILYSLGTGEATATTITSISESALVLKTNDGTTLHFDKNPGTG